MLDPTMTPGARIKLYRRRAGLTQEIAARLKGCTVGAWRKWESGERHVTSLTDWIDIARILRVRDLFTLTGLPVGQLPDDPPEDPALPAVRRALLSPAEMPDEPISAARLRGAVDMAWDVWHGSRANHDRVGVMLPELIMLAKAARGADRAADRRSAAEAGVALWLLVRTWAKWVGAHDLSMVAAERGVDAASDAGSPTAEAAAAWNAAMMLSTRGLPDESAEVAMTAVRALESRPGDRSMDELAILGALHLLVAIEYSRERDEHRAITAMEAADRLAARTGERNIFRTVFGPTNTRIYAATIALDQSRFADAVRISERIDVAAIPAIERRYANLFVLARAHALQGDDLAASVVLTRAADEYPQGARVTPAYRAVVRDLVMRETPTTRVVLQPLAERIRLT